MSDIKIFVSHRIDKEAEIIDNDLYIPVCCGATFDKNKNSTIIGDNTGDNISEKKNFYNELTVLYWAWKNQKADYYGLCHYRRFLSFSDKDTDKLSYDVDHAAGCIVADDLSKNTINKYNLHKDNMQKEIEKYDAVFMEPLDLDVYKLETNYAAMESCPDWHKMADVDLMLRIIKEKYPEMYGTAYEYMHILNKSFLYNCFIMKADIFNNFCSWLFDILFELEKQIDTSEYSQQQCRALAGIAERLVGIYELHLRKQKKYNIKYTPLIFINNSDKLDILPAFEQHNIPIVSNFNDKYAAIFSTFLASVIKYASDTNNYDFIILSNDITEPHKIMLQQMMKKNMNIRFISPKKYLADLELVINHEFYTPDLYYRVIMPQILKNYNKFVVIDADMICQEDIANIFNENIDSYLAGGCIDCVFLGYLNGAVPHSKEYAINYMKMSNPYLYINTGLLLFNAKKYREMYSLEFLKTFICKHIKHVRVYEQDMLNMLLCGNLKFLDAKWNTYTKNSEFIEKCFSLCPYEPFKKWENARTEQKGIIHYAAQPKPWWDTNTDMAHIWWEYARKTPFYEEILQRLVLSSVSAGNGQVLGYHPQKEVVKLFNVVPIFKKKSSLNKVKYYFFGLPLFKKKNTQNKIKYYFFGIPCWKTKRKGNIKKGYLFGFIPLLQCIKK